MDTSGSSTPFPFTVEYSTVHNMAADGVTSQWLRGVTDLVLLSCLEREPSYGYALLERLVADGLQPISEATVYGALRRLEGSGLSASSLIASDAGPARRYYELTDAGRASLAYLKSEWARFSAAVTTVTAPAEGES
jgi:PadR family transcriptional regulator PadR